MFTALDRTFGNYPMSMATSLALEGIAHTGDYADRTGDAPVRTMQALWVNLRTLTRNALNAFDSKSQKYVKEETIIECVESDWDAIVETMATLNPQCEVKLYVCTYEGINKEFPDGNFKNSSTPKAVHAESIDRAVIYDAQEKWKDDLLVFKTYLTGGKRCVLLTHHPLDLLSEYNFSDLSLLESHTGVIKTRRDWYTKLNVKKDVTCIPFNKAMLFIFGDGVTLAAQDIKARRQLISIGNKRNWNGLTTIDKILHDIKLEHEPHLVDFVRKYK